MVEIKKVIELFEKALSVYEKALSNKTLSYATIEESKLNWGICHIIKNVLDYKFNCDYLFSFSGYYKNYLRADNFIFKIPHDTRWIHGLSYVKETTIYHESLKFRRDFLKTEIKELNKLIKQGYTHI